MLRFSMRQPDETLPAPSRRRFPGALTTLFEPEAVVELRVLETERGVVSGYFDNPEKLVESVAMRTGVWSLRHPQRGEPRAARPRGESDEGVREKTTSDSEILRRRWLPIDLDPKRPAGICATDEEHEAAVQRVNLVRTWLTEQGWPEALILDSGNGAYLLYRIDLPNDDTATGLIKGCLVPQRVAGRVESAVDGEVAVPCNPQSVIAGLNSLLRAGRVEWSRNGR
jgi:hypothetical protein